MKLASWFLIFVGIILVIGGILALLPKITFIVQPGWYSWFQIILGVIVAAYGANELSK